ncbi:DUF4192 family protein [Citricoccus sp. SGAir0253]|uniref:DUF4192 family protein n=1 Tax=Citricoccus sp. SGAir0253 TaxID=2567881 RepID=UPI00143CF83F|nr:DUF4192 family protein [Citricoccus sp. SGAir0253]
MAPITTPNALAGAVPAMAGYQPTEHQLAVLGFKDSNFIGIAVQTWTADLGDGPAHAAEAAGHVDRGFGTRADEYRVLGYGPEGPDRALMVQDAIATRTGRPTHAWAVHEDQLATFTPGHGWTRQGPLEDTAATAYAMASGRWPAGSREELIRRYAPVPEHEQAHLDPDTAQRFATLAPTAQYEWASRALTEGAGAKTGLTDEQVAVIAHATEASVHIRDNLLADTIGDKVKADRLVDAFRRTDNARRPELAALAAAAQYINHGGSIVIEALRRHTTRELGRKADQAAQLGLDPQPLIDSMDRGTLRTRLAMADRHLYRSHVASNFPTQHNPDPRAPTRPAGGPWQQPQRHPGAWRHMDR